MNLKLLYFILTFNYNKRSLFTELELWQGNKASV